MSFFRGVRFNEVLVTRELSVVAWDYLHFTVNSANEKQQFFLNYHIIFFLQI